VRIKELSESGYPGFKDLENEDWDFITNYPLPTLTR
jgi:hypothetical protein